MIAAGSFIGFALAFVLLAWILSAVAGALVAARWKRLAVAGPAAVRTAATAALVVPPSLAAAAIAGIGFAQLGGADHCEAHAHHLHLCLAHGGAWASHVAPVAAVAALGVALALHVGARAVSIAAARRSTRALRRAGEIRRLDGQEVVVVPSPYRLSMTAGIVAPRVYMSTAVWDALDDGERRAVLAHETAHARARDVLRGLVLGAVAVLAAPRVGGRLLGLWRDATERLRDHDAAEATGDATLVGAALLEVARLPAAPRLATSAGLSADDDLSGRIEALLAGAPSGRASARRIARIAWIGGALALAAAVICAGPLHHALETLLSPL